MRDTDRLTRAAGVVSGATFLSRVTGFVRDVIIAQTFGAGFSADAFFVAFGIPSLFRRFFAEGALSAAFIPVFAAEREKGGDEAARRMSGALVASLAIIVAVVTLLGIWAAPGLVLVLVPGFRDDPQKLALTVTLTRLMFPFLFFICLAAVGAGILNTLRHFLTPALSPIFLNLSLIAFALALAPRLAQPVVALAWGVVLGGAAQLAVLFVPLWLRGHLPRPRWEPGHSGSRRVARLMGPAIFGMSVAEISVIMDRWLASFLAEGSISFLYYANRLVQFPLGVFGIAMTIAIFPTLSAQAARKDRQEFLDTLGLGARLILFLCLPATVGLVLLSTPIIHLLFERGAFTAHSTAMTAWALFYYAAGLIAFAGVKIVASAYYSLQDTATPVKLAAWALLANLIFNLILMGPFKHAGLALGSALAAYLNLGLLVVILRRRLGHIGGKKIARSFLRMIPAVVIMGIVVFTVNRGFFVPDGTTTSQALALGSAVVLGMASFFLVARVMRCEEMQIIWGAVRRKEKTPWASPPGGA